MIARFRALLPFTVHVKTGDAMRPHEVVREGEHFRVYPPYRSNRKPSMVNSTIPIPFGEVEEQLIPGPLDADPYVLVDGNAAIRADAVQIDLQRSGFDRTIVSGRSVLDEDPPVATFFDVANSVLARLRSSLQASIVKPLAFDRGPWVIEYLTDTAESLKVEEGKFRRRMATTGRWETNGLNQALWEHLGSLPADYAPPVWETLLLDASPLLPEVGPAIVLAAAALENLIADCLDFLAAHSTVPPGLWAWINDRGDYRKEPSTAEQYDVLLRALSSRSLKDEPEMWEAFKNLRDARNSFVHEGRAKIGNKPVTTGEAMVLIVKANQIVEWIEQLLPVKKRRQRCGAHITMTLNQPI